MPVSGSKVVLGILYEDHLRRSRIVAHELDLDKEEIHPEPSKALASGFAQDDASLLIPVAGAKKTTGVLTLGGETCHFFGSERAASKRATGDRETNSIISLARGDLKLRGTPWYAVGYFINVALSDVHTSFGVVDDSRWIVGDSFGQLYILGVEKYGPGGTVSSVLAQSLGQASEFSNCI